MVVTSEYKWNKLDTDGKKGISLEELAAAFGAKLAYCDIDGDGTIEKGAEMARFKASGLPYATDPGYVATLIRSYADIANGVYDFTVNSYLQGIFTASGGTLDWWGKTKTEIQKFHIVERQADPERKDKFQWIKITA